MLKTVYQLPLVALLMPNQPTPATAPTAAITLYAKWTANSYNVALNANTGTLGTTVQITATYGSAMPAITGAGALPTKPGYTFTGFFDAETGGNKYYDANGTSAKSWDKTGDSNTLYLPSRRRCASDRQDQSHSLYRGDGHVCPEQS